MQSVQLHQSLQKYFGFDNFKDRQEEIIQNILAGKDTLVIMPTGGGKSLCYQLPAIISPGTALIISPLIQSTVKSNFFLTNKVSRVFNK